MSLGKYFKKINIKSSGFTLLELLITISIFVVISAVVLPRHARFNNTIILTNLAYEMGLSIREAQTYGSSVKFFDRTSSYDQGYGIHFEDYSSSVDNSKRFILFADTNGNEKYDGDDDGANCLDIDGSECSSVYTIGKNNFISRFCATRLDGNPDDCYQFSSPRGGNIQYLDIMFFRPQQRACIRTEENLAQTSAVACSTNVDYSSAKICVRSPEDDERCVDVSYSGQIEIK